MSFNHSSISPTRSLFARPPPMVKDSTREPCAKRLLVHEAVCSSLKWSSRNLAGRTSAPPLGAQNPSLRNSNNVTHDLMIMHIMPSRRPVLNDRTQDTKRTSHLSQCISRNSNPIDPNVTAREICRDRQPLLAYSCPLVREPQVPSNTILLPGRWVWRYAARARLPGTFRLCQSPPGDQINAPRISPPPCPHLCKLRRSTVTRRASVPPCRVPPT